MCLQFSLCNNEGGRGGRTTSRGVSFWATFIITNAGLDLVTAETTQAIIAADFKSETKIYRDNSFGNGAAATAIASTNATTFIFYKLFAFKGHFL